MWFKTEFMAGRMSIWLALVSMLIAGVPSHGYTAIAFFVFLIECGAIWYVRHASKIGQDQHYAWYAAFGVIIVEVQQEWPPNDFMLWHTVILVTALVVMHFVAKAEVSYSGATIKV